MKQQMKIKLNRSIFLNNLLPKKGRKEILNKIVLQQLDSSV